jgi:hypothetical protein
VEYRMTLEYHDKFEDANKIEWLVFSSVDFRTY